MLKTYRVQALLLACILLPPHHLNTMAFFMEFLKKVSLCEKQNKMNVDNLAKVIGPNIMPLQEATMSAVQMRLELHLIIIKILIENAESIGILPDHITQAISMETIGSTDNELDISDHLHSKFRKKKHRSGSLTRKPHLSASNLNLRMFNGLKKIVGKNAASEEGNICDNQRIQEKDACNELHASNMKSTKKRKVEYLDPPNTKKKKVTDKTDKSKKLRLSLDRFVPRKPKTVDEDLESYANTFNTHTEQRWSSICNTCDSQRTCRAYSDGSSQLKFNLKDSEVSNELHKEYNNMFIDADVNLSDDSDEQVLLTKKDDINITKRNSQLSLEKQNILDNFDQRCLYPSKRKLTVNNFKTYSHVQITSLDNQSEEYVTIPKSEYEEIKSRVSAIESRLSQEFGCVNNENDEESDDLLPHSVKKVQTAYEKTLVEASIESTVTTDYLAKKLGKELKIRRSGEHKIIRSPSARKIGSLRRRSQERVMSKRIRRTASWHISRGSDLQSHLHQQNMILSNTSMSWRDAEGYFKSTNQMNSPVTQTGRASIAKLRTQNAGMVLAKAKLFDECTAKMFTQNTILNKKNDLLSAKDDQFINSAKQNCERTELCRKSNKSVKNKNPKMILKQSPSHIAMETENTAVNLNQEDTETHCYISNDSMTPNAIIHQKENMAIKTPPLLKKIPINTLLHESTLSMYKTDNNALCKTPHIKKPLTVKTPKSAKALVRKSVIDPRRTPLKAVSQLGTPKYHSPKSILKTPRNISRHT
ncbi:Rho GTPase-activating protein 11A [Habropoda laboriosa]|uniref:Rho GTPase-activating protein 11A n=1 Tax=Habropoda laboriosa TaxID=597456 RepID=A0A0L7R1I4_9HYME|nr:Rho GTPase-activating protein 11A [Habropoda laboriosa]